ncbi:MAG: hypothetical protein V9F82_11280 [Dermatophilaceae bacterium]
MKSRLLVLLSVSALVGLGACTSSPTTTATSTTATTSTIDGAVIGARMVEAMTKAGSGKGVVTTEGGGAGLALTGETLYSIAKNGTLDSKGTLTVGGQPMDVVAVGGTFYIKSAMFPSANGAPWVKIDPDATDAVSKQISARLSGTTDPRQQIEALKGFAATLVGTEGGLTHYKLTGAGSASATTGGPEVDVWLDSSDRPAKQIGTLAGVKVITVYSEWGTPVTIAAPPADQVGPPRALG